LGGFDLGPAASASHQRLVPLRSLATATQNSPCLQSVA
jgi:hypothetical protein